MSQSSSEPTEAHSALQPATEPVAHVAVQMPPFTSSNPTLFFRRAQTQFELRSITSQRTKYLHTFSAIPDDIAELCITEATDANPYDALKQEILSISDRTQHSKLAAAFADLHISDEKPSILLRRVRKIFADAGVQATDEMLVHKLVQALPSSLADLLHAHSQQPVDTFVSVADTVWAARASTTPSASAPIANSTHQSEPAAAACTRFSPRRQHNDLNALPPGLRPFHRDQRPVICRAHLYYGTDARSCRPWCRFPSDSPRLHRSQQTPSQSRDTSPASPGNRRAAVPLRPPQQRRQ